MLIIDIDADPTIANLDNATQHIFAGHIYEIIGRYNGKICKGQDLINNSENLDVIWINHGHNRNNNNAFSVKIQNKEIIKRFVNDYKDFLTPGSNFFVVCNDVIYSSHNPEYDHKKFLPIDTMEEYEEQFKMWKIN